MTSEFISFIPVFIRLPRNAVPLSPRGVTRARSMIPTIREKVNGEMRKTGSAGYSSGTSVYLTIDLDNSGHHGARLAGFLPAGK